MSKNNTSKVTKKDEVENILLQYINKNNRPFSPQMLENAHSNIGKTQLVKTLKYLAEQGKIAMKENGKQVLYWRNQDDDEDVEEEEGGEEEVIDVEDDGDGNKKKPKQTMEELTKKVETLSSEETILKEEFKKLQDQSKELSKQLTNQELIKELEIIMAENKELEIKLEKLKKSSGKATEQDKENLLEQHKKARSEWVKRKNLFKDILGTLLENTNKKKKDLQDKCGFELDEDLKITMIDDRNPNATKQPSYKRQRF